MNITDIFATAREKKARLDFVHSCLVAFAKYNVESGGDLPIAAMHEFAKGLVATLEAHIRHEKTKSKKVHTLFPFKRRSNNEKAIKSTADPTSATVHILKPRDPRS